MYSRNGLIAIALAGFTMAVTAAGTQQTPPPQSPPAGEQPQPPPPTAPGGPGQGRGQRGVFPAMQRPPADPAIVERGRNLFSVTCSACHGADARGGQLGGPNLLRSQLVLMDQNGEQILPVVQKGRPEKGMPPFPLPESDIKAIAEFIHSLTGASRGQGAPPVAEGPPPNILVGDASAGQAFFAAKCSACHSTTGDLQGIATRVPDPKLLQNLWVSGGLATGRGGGRGGLPPGPAITVTVTPPQGPKVEGRLLRIDDFVVSLMLEDGNDQELPPRGRRAEGRAARSPRRASHAAGRLHRQGYARRHGLSGHLEMTLKTLVPTIMSFVLLPALLSGQGKGVDPAQLLKPLGESWPTHSGDYTGRRFSSLKQIDRTTVKTLTLAWVQTLVEGPGFSPFGGRGGGRGGANGPSATPLIVGGEGTGEFAAGGMTTIKASALDGGRDDLHFDAGQRLGHRRP